MTDRGLLEKAARAGGIVIEYQPAARSNVGSSLTKFKVTAWHGPFLSGTEEPWNPLTDDGDALRLAVKLGISIGRSADGKRAEASHRSLPWIFYGDSADEAATRRAIVRAAAELANSIPSQGTEP